MDLVVEDEPLILDIIAETLEGAGYDVMRASTGPQAVGLIAAGKTESSALFSDFHLPGGLTGLDVAAVMRERFPGLPVILATGRPDVLEEPVRPPRATSCWKSRMGCRRCCGSSAGWSRRITGEPPGSLSERLQQPVDVVHSGCGRVRSAPRRRSSSCNAGCGLVPSPSARAGCEPRAARLRRGCPRPAATAGRAGRDGHYAGAGPHRGADRFGRRGCHRRCRPGRLARSPSLISWPSSPSPSPSPSCSPRPNCRASCWLMERPPFCSASIARCSCGAGGVVAAFGHRLTGVAHRGAPPRPAAPEPGR